MCLAAFVLALALALLSLVSLWAGLLLPMALGVTALATVDGARYRGRALAWWAVGIALVVGGVGFLSTLMFNRHIDFFANAFVSACARASAGGTPTRAGGLAGHRAHARRHPRADRGALAGDREARRHRAVIMPIWSGQFPLLLPPSGVVAVDEPSSPSTLPPHGSAVWTRLPFQKGEAFLALWMGDGGPTGMADPLARLTEGRAVPIVREARFFAAPALLGEATAPPKDR
jgi:hypothetical protein